MDNLKNQDKSSEVFVITGASRGLGKTLALEVAKKGHSVALIARGKKDLNEAEDWIKSESSNSKIKSFPCDLSDSEQVEKTFKDIRNSLGEINVLINNAATWTGGVSILDVTTESMQRSLDLNFFSVFNPSRDVLVNRDPKKTLTIINVGATASKRGGKKMAPFAIAKSALKILSESTARELGSENVHIGHLIIDGLIDNERTRKGNPGTESKFFISPKLISKSILNVVEENKNCWTFEWDIRPYCENW